MNVIRIILPILWIATALAEAEPPAVSRVVIVGLDGVSATGIVAAETPHMDRLMREGASTHAMRAVMPTASLPNWASFLMGAGPERHGVTSNTWHPGNHALTAAVVGAGGALPTFFELFADAGGQVRTGAYLDWVPIARFLEPDSVDVVFFPETGKETTESRMRRTEETMDKMIADLVDGRVHAAFAQLDSPDHFGHKFRWESQEYLESITHVDGLVGRLREALDTAGMLDQTLLIVVSDHGGIGTGHGGASDAEVLVPWMMRGPGVRAGFQLGPFASVEDTAPTVAAALGKTPPAAWSGRPLMSAFEWHPVPRIDAPATAPVVNAVVGEIVEVRFAATSPDGSDVELWVDWGAHAPLSRRASSRSGSVAAFSHAFRTPGRHVVRAQAAAGPGSISDAVPVAVFEVAADPAIPEGLVGLWEFGDPDAAGHATFGEDLIFARRAPLHHQEMADEREQPLTLRGVIVTRGGSSDHLIANHRIGGTGTGARTNAYSMIFDVLPPAGGGWHTFYQTDLANRGDAVFFMRATPYGGSPPDSIGRGGIGYSEQPLARGRWQRVAITVDLTEGGAVRSFVDGALFHEHTPQPPDSRWALDPRAVLLFADQDGENTPWAVAMAAIFDRALDGDAVQALGGAGEPVISHQSTNQPTNP